MGRKLERAELGHLQRSAGSMAALTKTELMRTAGALRWINAAAEELVQMFCDP
jgi:hypothetical protein